MKKIYPSKERILLDGGKNNKFERSLIPDAQSPDLLNIDVSDGAAGTREGFTKLNTAAAGSFSCDGLFTRNERSGGQTMVAFFGGDAFYLSGTTLVTIPSAQSVFTAGQRVEGVEYENYLFLGNGGTLPYKYNGTDYTRHGIYAPTATHTAATNSNGTLTGDYQYKVTYVNTNLVESDVGPVNSTFTASSEEVALTSLPVAPQSWGVAARRIYRTEAGGTTFKRLTEISDNTTTTYTDNSDDTELGVAAPTDQSVPPNWSICVYAKDRLFVNDPSNGNYVWYSELGNPYVFKATNFLLMGDNTSDTVKGLSFYNDTLYVIGAKTIEAYYMPDTDDSTWTRIKVKSAYGTKSHHGICVFKDSLMFPAMQGDKFVGFAEIKGDTTAKSASLLTVYAAGSDLKSNVIEPDMFLVPEAYVSNIDAHVFRNKAYFSLPYGTDATVNNRIYVYDFSIDNLNKTVDAAWLPWSSGIQAATFTSYDGKLYFGSALADGFVYQAKDTGVYNDEGAAIDSYIWTKEYAGGGKDYLYDKDFRYANILIDKAGAWFMDLTYRVDSDKGGGTTKQIDLDPGSNLWGVLRFGIDPWGGGSDQEDLRVYLDQARGKRVQFKFSNQNVADQRFKIYGLNFLYNIKGLR